jgi:hypothetical protein
MAHQLIEIFIRVYVLSVRCNEGFGRVLVLEEGLIVIRRGLSLGRSLPNAGRCYSHMTVLPLSRLGCHCVKSLPILTFLLYMLWRH